MVAHTEAQPKTLLTLLPSCVHAHAFVYRGSQAASALPINHPYGDQGLGIIYHRTFLYLVGEGYERVQ